MMPVTRALVTVALNGALLAGIGFSFWYADWQYSLPTPKPEGLVQQPIGSQPELPKELAAYAHAGRPLVVNFASAQCACTEFNLEHVRKLQAEFGKTMDFVTVLETNAADTNAKEEFESMNLRMPVVYDQAGRVSGALGVYGTPQAAILDREGKLYYRGNYNKSRYCADEATEFARIALNALAANQPPPAMPREARITYGCPLPHPFRTEVSRLVRP
jgi:hypothetical protein